MLETPGKSPFYAEGLCFSCTRCSSCCRFDSGYVFLSGKDASLLAAALNMGGNEFIETYCRWVPMDDGTEHLSLKEKSNNDCVFWKIKSEPNGKSLSQDLSLNPTDNSAFKGGCSVYETRPLQCRAFPFWPSMLKSEISWKASAASCPGMNKGTLHSRDAIEKWLSMQKGEPAISRNKK